MDRWTEDFLMRKPYPNNIPEEVYQALDVFTDYEIEMMTAVFSEETGEFEFIGLKLFSDKVVIPSEKEKFEAIKILEDQYKKELIQIHGFARRRLF